MGCFRTVDGSGSVSFKMPNTRVFTSSGTYTSPAGVNYIQVFVIGGGGGGGGGSSIAPDIGGCGGGASAPGVGFFEPGVFTFTIGTGGAGGATDTNGGHGVKTEFNTSPVTTILKGTNGFGGQAGSAIIPAGGPGGFTDGGSQYTLGRETGGASALHMSGYGGSNYFGTGGRGALSLGAFVSNGESGSGFGSGGSGGIENLSTGGAGAPGAVIIIEYF